MRKPKRLMVTERQEFELFDGSELRYLLDEIAKYPQISNWYIEVDYSYDGYGTDMYSLVGTYQREETEQEYTQRVSNEKRAREQKKKDKALKEAKEKAEYERLKAKFKDA